jgi:hypothetical protein
MLEEVGAAEMVRLILPELVEQAAVEMPVQLQMARLARPILAVAGVVQDRLQIMAEQAAPVS